MEELLYTSQVAERLNVSPKTIQNWTDWYGQFLSDQLRQREAGATRRFNDHDLMVMASIAELTEQGLTREQITMALKRDYRAVKMPEPPDPDMEAARRSIDLVPLSQVELWQDRYQQALAENERLVAMFKSEIERLTEERDRAIEGKEELTHEIADLREKLGAATKEAEMVREMLEQERQRKRGLFGR